MNIWNKFKDKIPSKEGFYVIKDQFGNIEHIFMSEIGQNSFGASSPKGFIYKYFHGRYYYNGPFVEWRLMNEGEKYSFHNEYLKQNGLIGLHNLKVYNKVSINPYQNWKEYIKEF